MMKKPLWILVSTAIFGVAASLSAQVSVVAGFDRFNDPFSNRVTSSFVNLTGITATIEASNSAGSTTDWFRSDVGSNDGTFGTFLTGADDTATTSYFGALTTRGNLGNDQSGFYLDISLSNNSGSDIELESLAFDAWRDFDGGPPRWDLSVASGDLTNGFVAQTAFITAQGSTPNSLNNNDYTDLNMVGLGALADNTLADGESAVLRLQIWESSFTLDAAGVMRVDNIAVTGAVVPEPATYALLSGTAVLGLVLLRRRLQKD